MELSSPRRISRRLETGVSNHLELPWHVAIRSA
jgi:hypothetical protein